MPIKQALKEEPQSLPGENPASAPAGMGHNRPPLEELIPAEFRAELLRERPEFLTKFDQLVEAAARAQAIDEETLGRCGDLVNAYRALIKHISETHKAVKEPHLLAGRLVDAEKNALIDLVETAKRKVEAIGNTYIAAREAKRRAEEERIAAEQRAAAAKAAAAERARIEAEQEAAAAAANAKNAEEREEADRRAAAAREAVEEAMADAALSVAAPSKAEPIRSDAGAAVSGKVEYQSQVEDYAKAFRAVKDDDRVKEAVDKAVARLVRAGKREMPGVRIWPVSKASFR
jgi:hypothetical protein